MYNNKILHGISELKKGKPVIFPTETVYGIGADATNDEAVIKIFRIKNRPLFNPLIIHVQNLQEAQKIGHFNNIALQLAELFWPGPLTIVVPIKIKNTISKYAVSGLNTIAIRVPCSKITLQLLSESGMFIAAPSANPSGYISSTKKEHILKHYLDKDIYIIDDDNEIKYGLESTIVSVIDGDVINILRHGFITEDTLKKVSNKILINNSKIMSPGMLTKHYSPKTKLHINVQNTDFENCLIGVSLNFSDSNLISHFSLNLSKTGSLVEAAANLYDYLHILDDYAITKCLYNIYVTSIPYYGLGIAINDKLNRASNE